jgi:NADPH-dependent 2,4-dienoyl-CoA reductase/sulfur reductase-like enzyme
VVGRPLLGFLDQEIAEAFHTYMRRAGITLRFGENVGLTYDDRERLRVDERNRTEAEHV